MNRRDFLRDTASASFASLGLGLSAGAFAEPLTPQRSDVREDKKEPPPPPVATAVIGLGPQGRSIIEALVRQNSAPRYLCDTFKAPVFLKKSTALAPSGAVIQDYRAILDDKTIQAVFVATPSHKHKQMVLDALQAGKHVYCEAPLAVDLAEAKEIAAAGANAKTYLMPGLQWRSNGQHKHVLKFLRADSMGRFLSGRSSWRKRTSWRASWPNPERENELNWRLNPATSLGLPGEIGIHHIDTAAWFFKALPLSVSGYGKVLEYQDGRQIPDSVQLNFEFPNGVAYNWEASLSSSFEGAAETFLGTQYSVLIRDQRAWMFKEVDAPLVGWEVFARKDELNIGIPANNTGEKIGSGIALVADATKQLALGKDPGKVGTDVTRTAIYQSIEAFLNSIRKSKAPDVKPIDGYQATVIAAKAHEALTTGNKIVFKPEWLTL